MSLFKLYYASPIILLSTFLCERVCNLSCVGWLKIKIFMFSCMLTTMCILMKSNNKNFIIVLVEQN